jgi:hypothetical protein
MRQDNQCLAAIRERLIARGVPPGKKYVDQAYMSGRHSADSRSKGIDLRGYVREGNLSKRDGFRLRDFRIEVQQRQVICPAGKKQAKWVREKPGVNNLGAYHVQFGSQCRLCPHFGRVLCTGKPNGRHLGIDAYHDLIQARRLETETEVFRQEMQIKAGIEGKVSKMVRSHGLRRSRFRRTRKNQLQALLGAVAANTKRLANCLFLSAWVPSRAHYLSTSQMA